MTANQFLDFKKIYSNISDKDAFETFFKCITCWSINGEVIESKKACYANKIFFG